MYYYWWGGVVLRSCEFCLIADSGEGRYQWEWGVSSETTSTEPPTDRNAGRGAGQWN